MRNKKFLKLLTESLYPCLIRGWKRAVVLASLALASLAVATTTQAAALAVAGSPTYDPLTKTGMTLTTMSDGWAVNNSGTAVGYAYKFINNSNKGYRGVRWDASGTAAVELGTLGSNGSGYAAAKAFAVDDAGNAFGIAAKYVNGVSQYGCAVRWDASGTVATELANLGTDSNGLTSSFLYSVNGAGMAVGSASKYVNGISKGTRAVRWDASGTVATELDNLGTDDDGITSAKAYAINASGTAVGNAQKYVNGSDKGSCAVRWDASGTAATELGGLGTASGGSAMALAVNNVGTAVGWASQYPAEVSSDRRAVRWDASSTVAAVLGNLGVDNTGSTRSYAVAVNDAGTAVGYASKYVNYRTCGNRAVRWDASNTAAIELGNLGTDNSGFANSYAYAVNGAGTAAGSAEKYVAGSYKGSFAVIWLPDASVVDLNDLHVMSVPSGGSWILTTAKALSSDGWVAGEGYFDPDGNGILDSYARLWVAQVGLGGTWTQADGGTWGRGPNWSTGTPAMQVGNATFNLNSAYSVALDRDELTKSISVNAGTVTIVFNGHKLSTETGMSIGKDATLKGAGRIVSDIVNQGTIAPGDSLEKLDIEGDLLSTNMIELEIAGLASHDEIDVAGEFNASGKIAVKLAGGYTPAYGDTFHLMSFDNFTDSGYAFDFTQAGLTYGLEWDTATFATTGIISIVPEPSTIALLGMGVIGLIGRRKRGRESFLC